VLKGVDYDIWIFNHMAIDDEADLLPDGDVNPDPNRTVAYCSPQPQRLTL